MSYLIVHVSHRADPNFIDSSRPLRRGLDGRPLRPGTYASQVKEILPAQAVDGRYVPCGYHVVLWPMDQHAPLYETMPLHFGPFVSRVRAESFVLEISTVVKPVEAPRAPAAVRSHTDSGDAGDSSRTANGTG